MGNHTVHLNLAICLLCIFSPFSSGQPGCPANYDLDEPCQCFAPFGQVFFECSGVKSHLEIQKSMKSMEGHHIGVFILRDSNLSYIPSNLFTNTTLQRIKIFKTELFYLYDRPLEGAIEDSLKEVILEDVTFGGGLDWNVFENLKELQLLSLQRVDLYHIPNSVRRLKLPVESLFVSSGTLMSISEGAFRKFKNLKNLKLDQNELKTFNRSMLPYPVANVQHLDLSYNKLSVLPNDMFDGIPQLNSLLLRGNYFYALHEEFMLKVWNQLFYFDIGDNPIICDCYIRWIVKNERPVHMFGTCASTSLVKSKSLVSLNEDDFMQCN